MNKCYDLMLRMGMVKHGDHKRNIYENAFDNSFFESERLNEEDTNAEESQKVKEMIISNKYWIRNDYQSFLNSLKKSTRTPFLSKYTVSDLKNNGVQTYQLYGYNIGYALKPDSDGYTDIISVHNNERA